MELFQYKIDNGIRLVHYQTSGRVAYCGLMINTGSCDEDITAGEHGAAHFIEHMFFKGTSKRKTYHILSYLDDSGGELNAYTTKEETAIYASVLKEDIERVFNIISDIAFNSIFPDRELEKEKDVIIEEINSYLDSPDELIFDDFEELLFKDQPMGRNILGTPESVQKMTSQTLKNFTAKNYYTDEMVFCIAGNFDQQLLVRLFHKYFSQVPARTGRVRNNTPYSYKPATETKKYDTFQAHCIIGNVAYGMLDKHRLGLTLLNNVLGGQGLTSRLNLSLREKNGLAYNVESSYTPYNYTGVFSIYFGTDACNLDKGINITKKELDKLRTTPLGSIQLSKAKNQLKGYLTRSYENYENLMLNLCKNYLTFNKISTIEDMYAQIDSITTAELLEIANEIFEPSQLSILIYK